MYFHDKNEVIMIFEKNKIGLIGAGNMAEAIIGAIVQKLCKPDQISISDIRPERLSDLYQKYGIHSKTDNNQIFQENDIIIIAVKPQQISEAFHFFKEQKPYPILKRKLIISIAAGIPIRALENYVYPYILPDKQSYIPIARVMPNTPSLVQKGMSGVAFNQHINQNDQDLTLGILNAMGKVIQVSENELDAVTAISGSGPAYVFYFIESMIEGAIKIGFSQEIASQLTLETFRGALALLEKEHDTAENLRKKVTSPGGTTEAAINHMELNNVRNIFIQAIQAALIRAGELKQ